MQDVSFPKLLNRCFTVDELLSLVSEPVQEVKGNPAVVIKSVAALDDAQPGSLVFCSKTGPSGDQAIELSNASVVIAYPDVSEQSADCMVLVHDPMRWFICALDKLFPSEMAAKIDSSAMIHPSVVIGKNVSIGPYAVIAEGVTIGDRTTIGSHAVIEKGVQIGHDVVIASHSSIGVEGLAVAWSDIGQAIPFPHLGSVWIGNKVRIGSLVCVVRGILKDTRIGDGTQIGNQVNVGHNVQIGESAWISSQVVLCGSAQVENNVKIGAKATINNHVVLEAESFVGLGAVVTKSVQPGKRVFGVPAKVIPSLKLP